MNYNANKKLNGMVRMTLSDFKIYLVKGKIPDMMVEGD